MLHTLSLSPEKPDPLFSRTVTINACDDGQKCHTQEAEYVESDMINHMQKLGDKCQQNGPHAKVPKTPKLGVRT